MTLHRRLLATLSILLLFGLIAASCGDDDDSSSSADDTAPSDDTAGDDTAEDDGAAAGDDTAAEDDSTASDGTDEDGTAAEDGVAPIEGDEDAAAMDPVVGGELTYGIVSDGTGFDTTGGVAADSLRIATAMNDSLVNADENGDWHPNLAESLTPNDDFTMWTITLREGVTFHDGEPVDAAAVAANLNAQKDSSTAGFTFAAVSSIEAVDDLTVEVTMSSPWAAFPFMLIGQPGMMVSPSTLGSNDTFVGTGPFMLETWTPGDSARVVRYDDYWRADEGFPYLDAITFKVIPDQAARRQAFEAGDIDAYVTPGDVAVLDFLEDDSVDVYVSTAPANDALVILNTTTAPTDDLRIRKAMAHALDRDLLIETFRSGLTDKASSFIDTVSPFWVETDYPEFDLDLAASLVEEYAADNGPPMVTIKASNLPGTLETTELITSFWNDAGIETTVEPIQPGTEVTPVITDDFQAIMWIQFSQVDPDSEYVFFHSSGGPINWSNLVDADIDAGFDQARQTDDPAERAAGYALVQEAMASQLPMLWIDHLGNVDPAIARPEVHGIPTGTFADGTPTIGMWWGSYFSWEDVWLG